MPQSLMINRLIDSTYYYCVSKVGHFLLKYVMIVLNNYTRSIPCYGKFYPLNFNSITSLRNKFSEQQLIIIEKVSKFIQNCFYLLLFLLFRRFFLLMQSSVLVLHHYLNAQFNIKKDVNIPLKIQYINL